MIYLFNKLNEGYLALALSVFSIIIPKLIEESSKNLSYAYLSTFFSIIFITNFCFEYIHSLKRVYIGGDNKIKMYHVIFSSIITVFIFLILCEFLYMNEYYICIISILFGYFLYYCRLKGRKNIYVTIFSSSRELKKKNSLYRYEMLYDKNSYNKLDILILYGYITLEQLEYCKITALTNNDEDILKVIKVTGYISDNDLIEVNYIYNYYLEYNVLIDKDKILSIINNKR